MFYSSTYNNIEFQSKFENGAVLVMVCICVSIPVSIRQHIEFQPKFENGAVFIVVCIYVSILSTCRIPAKV